MSIDSTTALIASAAQIMKQEREREMCVLSSVFSHACSDASRDSNARPFTSNLTKWQTANPRQSSNCQITRSSSHKYTTIISQ